MRCRANEGKQGKNETQKRKVRKSLKSFPQLWCVLLSRAPPQTGKRIVGEQSPERMSVSHAMFLCFCCFLFVFHARDSALPFLRFVHRRRGEEVAAIRHALATTATSRSSCHRHGRHRVLRLDKSFLAALDRDAHVASVSSLATIALILADAALNADTGVLAATTRSLAIAALLALAAALAARLRRKILLVSAKGVLEVDGGGS
jgi:hypothetical protein